MLMLISLRGKISGFEREGAKCKTRQKLRGFLFFIFLKKSLSKNVVPYPKCLKYN